MMRMNNTKSQSILPLANCWLNYNAPNAIHVAEPNMRVRLKLRFVIGSDLNPISVC